MRIDCVICDKNGTVCQRPLAFGSQFFCEEHMRGMGTAEHKRIVEIERLTEGALNAPGTLGAIKAMHLIGLHLRHIQKAARQTEVRGRFAPRFETKENR